ncbi:MAG: TolC family protein [Candidatus Omnitrophica bacterium]|nr:TolC family protein [Candidatus Omnitrophota bacterium]MDD3987336.1 TolC family protein [Candidatus Omnitrophota bacterium]MDD4981619.1 TolC family protein [Candidatus Omnitrophota bacterium]MDD5665074.1 TolC family protein [Candidatus Omnitrophota bacterium]
MKTAAVIAIILFLPLSLLIAEEMPLSIEEALIIALRDNRNILLGEEELIKAKAKIAESHADLFPSLTFLGDWTYTRGYYSKDMSQTGSQVSLKQYLYTGGKTFNTIKYTGYIFEVSQALLDKSRIETALDVKKSLYTLLLAQEYSKLNKVLLDNGKEHLDFMKEKHKFGEASDSQVLQAEASLSNLTQVYESSLNQISLAQETLNNLLYLDKTVNIVATGEFYYDGREAAFDEGLLKALEVRPEIKQYAAQINADKRSIEIAKSSTRPSIYAGWDYYSRSHAVTTTVNTRDWHDYNVLGATFSWPIFDGWKAKAKVEQAVIDLKKTQILKDKAIKDITLELKDAYLSLKDALSKIKSSESDLKMYEDNFKVMNKKYAKGEASFLDKSDANAKYAVSQFSLNQASYDYMVAKAEFDKATGGF